MIKRTLSFACLLLITSGCGEQNGISRNGPNQPEPATAGIGKDGPDSNLTPAPHQVGDVTSGKEVFRFETFGNEGFWTDAMRVPQGVLDKELTPIQALEVGFQVDIELIDETMKTAMAAELKTDMSPKNAPLLNDVKTTVKLIEANAVIGVVTKDSNQDGKLNIAGGDKVGLSCALCHTVTDGSVYRHAKGGSIGRRIDGLAALDLNVGKIIATAANSRAYYPNLQLELGGKTIGRAPKGLKPDSTEEEVDAYLSNPEFYPIGTFDETQDGIGNPVVNTPLFRQDLAAPYGSAGEHAILDNIGNGSYTTNLDPTTLVTPEGREFLKLRGGKNGEELTRNYAKILEETGVKGHPYVKAAKTGKVGDPATPVGLRVDNKKLFDMNAYLDSLPAPEGAQVDKAVAARGREHFRANCTSCHNVDQSKFVPPMLVELKTLVPSYDPKVLEERTPPQTPIQDSPGGFDDKMIVIDASDRGEKRGNALPLLLDLARKKVFLHDASVNGLESLLNPSRGESAPHPFYMKDADQRKDVIEFLRGLDTSKK